VAALALVGSVAAAVLTGSGTVAPLADSIRVLQLNLCDSGMAPCYTTRSVAAAAAVIRAERPDVVTLNEVCRDGVISLAQTLEARRGGRVVWAFQPALDRTTGTPYVCRGSRQPFGNGIVVHLSGQDFRTYGGTHVFQDPGDSEDRSWVCIAIGGGPLACTTHLANTSVEVALAQCGYLFATVIPSTNGYQGGVVLAGDLNLPLDAVRSCVPSGYRHLGDGGLQQVIVSGYRAVGTRRQIDMGGATDHPALLVTLTTSGNSDAGRA